MEVSNCRGTCVHWSSMLFNISHRGSLIILDGPLTSLPTLPQLATTAYHPTRTTQRSPYSAQQSPGHCSDDTTLTCPALWECLLQRNVYVRAPPCSLFFRRIATERRKDQAFGLGCQGCRDPLLLVRHSCAHLPLQQPPTPHSCVGTKRTPPGVQSAEKAREGLIQYSAPGSCLHDTEVTPRTGLLSLPHSMVVWNYRNLNLSVSIAVTGTYAPYAGWSTIYNRRAH